MTNLAICHGDWPKEGQQGNRTTANGITYVPNNLNQYSTVNSVTHTYSNNGNLTGDGTNTYGYDVESRLTSFSKSGTTASYTYDAFNRRVSKTVNGTTIYYVYDGEDIIEERSSAGALNADWVHGDEIDEPLTMTRGGNNVLLHKRRVRFGKGID